MNAKPLFILIMFILFIALMAGGSIGGTDLTPDTPPAATAAPGEVAAAGEVPAASGSSPGVLYTSPCRGVYTVQSGDTLSQIAVNCGIPLADMIAANPAIPDPNLIQPGQQVNIPAAAAAAPVLVEPTPVPTAAPAAAEAASGALAPEGASTPAAAAPDLLPEGLVPGGIIHVTVKNLPPTTPVSLGIGRAEAEPTMVEDRITDEKGELIIHLAIPRTAKPGEQWMVSVLTMTKPKTLVQSVPFTIQ